MTAASFNTSGCATSIQLYRAYRFSFSAERKDGTSLWFEAQLKASNKVGESDYFSRADGLMEEEPGEGTEIVEGGLLALAGPRKTVAVIDDCTECAARSPRSFSPARFSRQTI